MKNTMKRLSAAFVALIMLVGMTACGGAGMSSNAAVSAPSATPVIPAAPMKDAGFGYDYSGGNMNEEMAWEGEAPEPMPESSTAAMPQKMILRADLTLETTDYDGTVSGIRSLTEELGGYVQDSSVGGKSYRWGNFTVRIPVANYNAFLDRAGELCVETYRSTSQEDISEAYYDSKGRLETQQIKLGRLQDLLKQAENMEDIITIENAISETEQSIDWLSGTLRHYDALVDYSTISISLQEVYQFSEVEQTPATFGERLANAFSSSLTRFGRWVEELVIGIAYDWPFLLTFAVVAAAVVAVFRKLIHGRRNRKAEKLSREAEKKETGPEQTSDPEKEG